MVQIKTRTAAPEMVQAIEAQGYDAVLATLFAARGMQAEQLNDASLKHLIPPPQLTGSQAMAVMLADAIAERQKILIVGDYDADGATATAVGMKGLSAMGAMVDFLVPNRFEYGYGLTPEIVDLAHGMQADVLLTVDNGIASIDGVAHANALGMKVLITDHHLPAEIAPDAACIVNPNQVGCDFPSKNLAGVGVMFYVLLALRAELRSRGDYDETSVNLAELLDLVALGTVADLVKLDANNRILVEQGLRRMRAGKACAGIQAILMVAGKTAEHVNAQDLGFYVGPRLNAAGRLDDMTIGIRCLLAGHMDDALSLAEDLQALNAERKQIEADMQQSAMLTLPTDIAADQYTITLYEADWHQGVIGILASRIKAQFHRPVITFADAGDGTLKGSGRSIQGLHLRDALDLVTKQAPDLILKFGGHAMAAGLTIKQADFVQFQTIFEQVVQGLIDADTLQETIETDGALPAQALHLTTAETLGKQVWGQGFAPPMFYDVFTIIDQKILKEKHLKLRVKKENVVLDAIYFNHAKVLPSAAHLVYELNVNAFNGHRNVQLLVKHAHALSDANDESA